MYALRFTLLFLILLPGLVLADERMQEAAKASIQQLDSQHDKALRYLPVHLRGGSQITLATPSEWEQLAQLLSTHVELFHNELEGTFGRLPAFATTIRLMDEDSFFRKTGAPSWTNALFLKGEIIVPLSMEQSFDWQNLERTLRHEYTHAAIDALSKGRCPGWLDEGIAQWAEGAENPSLRPALAHWLNSRAPVTLHTLRGGFTKLPPEMVPAAYAQSLFAANTLMAGYSSKNLRGYLEMLKKGEGHDAAFLKSFGIDQGSFERQLTRGLQRWARDHHRRHK